MNTVAGLDDPSLSGMRPSGHPDRMAIIQPSVGPIKSDLRWVNAQIGSTTLKELNHWSIVPLIHGFGTRPCQPTQATVVRSLGPRLRASREPLANSHTSEKSVYPLVGKIRLGPKLQRTGTLQDASRLHCSWRPRQRPERRALLGPRAHGPRPTRQPFPPSATSLRPLPNAVALHRFGTSLR
jgi:hypothetical protein